VLLYGSRATIVTHCGFALRQPALVDGQAHRSVRIVELSEERCSIDELAPICLRDRLQKLLLLLGSDVKCLVFFTPEDGNLFTFRKLLALHNDEPIHDRTGDDLHAVILPRNSTVANSEVTAKYPAQIENYRLYQGIYPAQLGKYPAQIENCGLYHWMYPAQLGKYLAQLEDNCLLPGEVSRADREQLPATFGSTPATSERTLGYFVKHAQADQE
jgi:hypothetical protein